MQLKLKILIIIILTVLWGCASRNVNTDISKTVDKQTNDYKESGEAKQEEKSKSEESNVTKNDKEDTETTTTTNEKFNPDGSVNERTTTTSNKRTIDKTVTTFKRTVTIIKTYLVRYNINKKEIVYRTTYIKSKESSANNYGWIAFALVVVYLAYLKFFKK